jgi:hypothetical protein
VWGPKPRHLIAGTVGGLRIRGAVEAVGGLRTRGSVEAVGGARTRGTSDRVGDRYGFTLGPAWLRDCDVAVGDTVTVDIHPEGPQRADLPDDLAAALDAHPQAGAFFDALAQFYRRAYLRWIEATKRRPEQRPHRIAEVIRLLEAGVKERPKP